MSSIRLLFFHLAPLQNSALVTSYHFAPMLYAVAKCHSQLSILMDRNPVEEDQQRTPNLLNRRSISAKIQSFEIWTADLFGFQMNLVFGFLVIGLLLYPHFPSSIPFSYRHSIKFWLFSNFFLSVCFISVFSVSLCCFGSPCLFISFPFVVLYWYSNPFLFDFLILVYSHFYRRSRQVLHYTKWPIDPSTSTPHPPKKIKFFILGHTLYRGT